MYNYNSHGTYFLRKKRILKNLIYHHHPSSTTGWRSSYLTYLKHLLRHLDLINFSSTVPTFHHLKATIDPLNRKFQFQSVRLWAHPPNGSSSFGDYGSSLSEGVRCLRLGYNPIELMMSWPKTKCPGRLGRPPGAVWPHSAAKYTQSEK